MVEKINYTCQGESHKSIDKPCQDYSHCSITDDGIAIAIVCDGHGGERYFRSKEGAEFAARITEDAIRKFVRDVDPIIFLDKPYTAVGPSLPGKGNIDKPTNREYMTFRQLFSSIIYQWGEQILEHAKSTPLNDWEKHHVKQKYLDDFLNSRSLEKTYGCTLMAYVQTSNYWFAFHIGDGKMITYNVYNGKVIWKEPVPWDDRCFLNKTTSLCDSDALNEFRYCYEGDGMFPMAVFLGSDGLDDSFGDITNLVNFYVQIIKMIVNDGLEATQKSLEETLPQLSKIGSKDDMSVASIFNPTGLAENVNLFIDWQRSLVLDRIDEINMRIRKISEKKYTIEKSGKTDNATMIDLNYAVKDLDRAINDRRSLIKRYNILAEELGDSHYCISEKEGINSQDVVIKTGEKDARSEKKLEESHATDRDRRQIQTEGTNTPKSVSEEFKVVGPKETEGPTLPTTGKTEETEDIKIKSDSDLEEK